MKSLKMLMTALCVLALVASGGAYARGGSHGGGHASGARGGTSYVTCHDSAGRVTSTTDPLVTGGAGTAAIMNSVPARQRGAASGMLATFQNSGFVLSIGIFFSLMITGLASTLPTTLTPLAKDLAFLRRVTLDTVGVVPTAAEIRAFLADAAADRRSKVIDKPLSLKSRSGSGGYMAGMPSPSGKGRKRFSGSLNVISGITRTSGTIFSTTGLKAISRNKRNP